MLVQKLKFYAHLQERKAEAASIRASAEALVAKNCMDAVCRVDATFRALSIASYVLSHIADAEASHLCDNGFYKLASGEAPAPILTAAANRAASLGLADTSYLTLASLCLRFRGLRGVDAHLEGNELLHPDEEENVVLSSAVPAADGAASSNAPAGAAPSSSVVAGSDASQYFLSIDDIVIAFGLLSSEINCGEARPARVLTPPEARFICEKLAVVKGIFGISRSTGNFDDLLGSLGLDQRRPGAEPKNGAEPKDGAEAKDKDDESSADSVADAIATAAGAVAGAERLAYPELHNLLRQKPHFETIYAAGTVEDTVPSSEMTAMEPTLTLTSTPFA